ncbi:MAG: hypothetical protein G01um101418_637 [Parcubacteria group bacterium Gr01-1014_18]|nr:MAG: hypothetical protein Greene041636_652 [Parcubacteria group bacterium Greene0416_36]TSC80718.1 MAG: hypothetical protein G01um101418_637 [Parcubacteria group bacterium Gr01-1014_18]TSC98671.1 MAG: hypothetical protein Greene101420_630 [Parcubacteria group bacterium Greene1014_20]TSD07169.1 MAG: hypothetical protein Greene07142_338 [Parcubacteria group bacterium Greene0714_2]
MNRIQNSLVNIVRAWTGVQDLSLLPKGHPARFFLERSLDDLESSHYQDLLSMLDEIGAAYWEEVEKMIPAAREEFSSPKEQDHFFDALRPKVPFMQRFRYEFLSSQIIEIIHIKNEIMETYGQKIGKNAGAIGLKITLLTLALILLAWAVVKQFEKKAVVDEDEARRVNLIHAMEGIGKYFITTREKDPSQSTYPHITDRENGWEQLHRQVSTLVPNFLENPPGEKWYYYISNGPQIGAPGTCFAIDVRLENKDQEANTPSGFLESGCDTNNNLDCFFKAGVYETPSGTKYFRLVGGGC